MIREQFLRQLKTGPASKERLGQVQGQNRCPNRAQASLLMLSHVADDRETFGLLITLLSVHAHDGLPPWSI